MRAAKRDGNEAELVRVARQMGVYMVKAPPVDWLAGFRSTWKLVEIKNLAGKNRYTPVQVLFFAECLRRELPLLTWRTVDDVVASVNTWDSPRAA